MRTITGSIGDDIIRDNKGATTIRGRRGDDIIFAQGQDDIIFAGGGDDIVFAGNGDDEVRGNDGDDILFGGNGDDLIFGGNGDDIIITGDGADVARGGNGDDFLVSVGSGEFEFLDQSYLTAVNRGNGSGTIAVGPGDADADFALTIGGADFGTDINGDIITVTENRISATAVELDFSDYLVKRISVADVLIGGAGSDIFEAGAEVTAILDFNPHDDLIVDGGFVEQVMVEDDGAAIVGFQNAEGQLLLVGSSDASAAEIVTAVTDQALMV